MADLVFNYGAMGCGKTSLLIHQAYDREDRGFNVKVFKPADDTKAGDEISSRDGLHRKVDALIASNVNINDYLDQNNLPDFIFIDEAQFLTPEQVIQLYELAKKKNVQIEAYGLRVDFSMHPFEGSAMIMANADYLFEMRTICECKKEANHIVRYHLGEPVFEGDTVVIDNDKNIVYKSFCGECYLKIRDSKKEENK